MERVQMELDSKLSRKTQFEYGFYVFQQIKNGTEKYKKPPRVQAKFIGRA